MSGPLRNFRRNWFRLRYMAVGGICSFAVYFLGMKAGTSPDVVWSRANPQPWNTIHPNETIKAGMMLGPRIDPAGTPQRTYKRKWSRWESAQRHKEGNIISYKTKLEAADSENRAGSEN
ncbi:hypothetical protein M422DRAFT_260172 [Sphaerobolus stellatus SS14]|uniref:Uncharacterized protein n=1 Tax=Sphaerobolus stellatus (strain SS14) TaxID=990650 RepID=A0A0C9VIV7_SPHS4|nr:hypothetical protein M422DRAFT_260172 [Sphaerobolus stellatus SS14]